MVAKPYQNFVLTNSFLPSAIERFRDVGALPFRRLQLRRDASRRRVDQLTHPDERRDAQQRDEEDGRRHGLRHGRRVRQHVRRQVLSVPGQGPELLSDEGFHLLLPPLRCDADVTGCQKFFVAEKLGPMDRFQEFGRNTRWIEEKSS